MLYSLLVQRRELLMVLFCCLVVCLCGLFFVFEIPDAYVLSFIAYNNSPFLAPFPPTDSRIFRGFILSKLFPVIGILGACCEPEVGFSIVQAVMINVVDEEMAGRL